MKKVLLIVGLILLNSCLILPHRQHVHQRVVMESYNLLKLWMNRDIPIMKDKVGLPEHIGGPWAHGMLTTGAWREDVEDIVYGYSLANPPNIAGFTANLVQILGSALGNENNDGYISITHFWNADAGDNISVTHNGALYVWPAYHTYQITVPNAYQKMMRLIQGDYDLNIQIRIRDFPNGTGSLLAEQDAIVSFRYGYLPEYYRTKALYVTKVTTGLGQQFIYQTPILLQSNHYALTNSISYENFKENIVWEILGRMSHLLQDMGSPAHANVDDHGGGGLRHDSFEEVFGDISWTANMVFNQTPNLLDPFIDSNPVHFLMYILQQQSSHFASNGPHMVPNNDVFAGNATSEELNYLNNLNISQYGLPLIMQENIPVDQLYNIRDKMFPQIIKANAALLYWFACEAGLLNRVKFKNIFEAGNLGFDNEIIISGTKRTLFAGDSHILTALPQSINNNYYVWNNNAPLNRSTWRKYVNENLVPLSNNTNQTFNLNVSNQDFNSTYLADLKLNCKISQLYQTEFDGTLNGPTNWIIKENSDIIIAPLDSVNYVFSHWIDNYDRSNSRVITPTDNTTYTAFYKAHLLTNSTSATSNNNQRKIIQDSNASWAMVYVSSNNVWLSRSTDGVNWGNEILISDGYGEVKSNPTISVSGVVAKIVWQELSWSGGGGFETAYIFMRSFNLIDNTLSTTTLVDNFNPDVENFESNPVLDGYWDVMGNSDSYMVAWKEPDGIKLKYYNSSTGWSGKTNLSGTNSNSNNPSIVNYNGSIFFLCWEDRYYNKIKFIEASYSPSWYFSSISEISPSNWESNFRPQMTLVSGNKPTIVWTSRNNIVEGGASVHIRQRIGSTWQNITSFSQVTTESLNPVIGDYYGVNRFEVLWNIGNTVYKASYNGTSWTGPTTITTSGGAGININRNGTTKTKAIWRKSNNTIAFGNIGDLIPPVEISVETELKLSKEDSNDVETFLPYKLNRHAIVNLQNVVDSSVQGSVCFEIAGINYLINNSVTKIDYSSIEDNVLSSELFTINDSRMELVFNGAIYGLGLELNESILSSIKEPLAKVVLKESNTNEVLENIWVNNASMLSHVQNKTFGEFRKEKINLNKHLGKTVYLEVEMLGKSKNILPLIVDDYLILSDTVRKGILNKYSGNIFSDYTLLQNYPNPFNPNTTISFFIPQNQFVTLKIYSSLGEEIMSVINKDLEQGYHSVVINMNNEPSGVYFYSLSAGNYKDTKKLILLK